jgi:hypothetical protein
MGCAGCKRETQDSSRLAVKTCFHFSSCVGAIILGDRLGKDFGYSVMQSQIQYDCNGTCMRETYHEVGEWGHMTVVPEVTCI